MVSALRSVNANTLRVHQAKLGLYLKKILHGVICNYAKSMFYSALTADTANIISSENTVISAGYSKNRG